MDEKEFVIQEIDILTTIEMHRQLYEEEPYNLINVYEQGLSMKEMGYEPIYIFNPSENTLIVKIESGNISELVG